MDPGLFRDEKSIRSLLREAERLLGKLGREIKIMEVCGTHTMAAYRSGLGALLRQKGLKLISGPGCPVCITPDSILGPVAELITETPGIILASFGDMLRVPTSRGSLLHIVPREGSQVKVIYSPEEVLDIAASHPEKEVVFLAVGFETTIPSIAWIAGEAEKKEIGNLSLMTCLRLVPPPLRAILSSGEVALDGFLYPGHVSVIIGSRPYEFIAEEFGVPGAITGFEPADLLLGILSVLKQQERGEARVDIAYKRAVKPEGNVVAREIIESVFSVSDGEWRGFGMIPMSGLKLKNRGLDTAERFSLSSTSSWVHDACRCGEIVKGVIEPEECPLFGKACTPEKPLGPCMVTFEGTCLIHYKYGNT